MTSLQLIAGRRSRRRTVQRLLRSVASAPPVAKCGILIVSVYAIVAIFAPYLAPYTEVDIVAAPYLPADGTYLLGTDQLGRDILSRLIFGARNTLSIALATVLLSLTVGGGLGIVAAMQRGWIDQASSRVADLVMSIPSLICALMLLSIFGSSVPALVLVIAALDSVFFFRLSRAASLGIASSDFVEVARLRGEGIWWIAIREILPNISGVLAAECGLRFCFVFLTISALSFLGLGIQPPSADWGSMVRENASLLTYGEVTPIIPALAIALLTVAVNFIVDWILADKGGRP